MVVHFNQRVGVFIDVQNMYYSAKQLYGKKVNYANILKNATAGRKLIRAITYVIKADIKEESNFFDALEKIGYEVRSKDLQIFFGGAKKGDWDVGIAMDVMKLAPKLDVVILVSGDGDFKDLLEHCKALGCRTEVMAFGQTASSRIKKEADYYLDMDKHVDKYLIGGDITKKGVNPKNGQKKSVAEIGALVNIRATTTDGFEDKVGKVQSNNSKIPAAKPRSALKQGMKPRPMQNQGNNQRMQNNKPFVKKPFVKKPFVKNEFDNRNKGYNRDNNRNNNRGGFQKKPFERRGFDGGGRPEVSLIDQINMQQPNPMKKENVVPKKTGFKPSQKPVVKKVAPVVKKPVSQKPVGKKVVLAVKKPISKKPTAKKSVSKKSAVIKTVEKKKPVKKAVVKKTETKKTVSKPKETKKAEKPKKKSILKKIFKK
ncbi:NYN domain-containing protein [archaeon]|jgi:uncharacterized LabA/DUF88 family protein|nr:NYN domain-containing protein [archaeon]MBT7393133.1 NYN domain-containing protein [archaeon]